MNTQNQVMPERRSGHSAPADNVLADTVDEAARRLSVSRGFIYKQARLGRLKLTKIGGKTLVMRTEQARLLAEATGAATPRGETAQ
jgi:excisionase family DNA binding protein